ncbi:MAG TPA: ergothioneine biosynthesis protein EgtB [Paucimonas sp.]|nr:ergothioneine biosynthesis protein EgtB [Paucimonas sp.]
MNGFLDRRVSLVPAYGVEALGERYRAVREHTVALAAPLSEEDCCAQSMPDASPVKWHLAHTTWFFETFVLERFERDFRPFHPAFRMLFNSYYNGVGEKHPRPLRGLLTRPGLREVLAYRRDVDRRMTALLGAAEAPHAMHRLAELGLQHEQQHQELILTDVKHLLSLNPVAPAYDAALSADDRTRPDGAPALDWIRFRGGVVEIGHGGTGFCFDNEMPRHRQFLEPFHLASRLVSNGDFAAFIEAGGYRDPGLWLAEGWDWICAGRLARPLYWREAEEGGAEEAGARSWLEFTLRGLRPLEPEAPAMHLSYFEADAYARWAGARLPTEAEWEAAAASAPAGLSQLFGVCWQWTSSSYAPYPGFRAAEGAIGEYNGKFMVNQYVLRGSSLATPAGHARPTYRNFFPAGTRWQFAGIRLAK